MKNHIAVLAALLSMALFMGVSSALAKANNGFDLANTDLPVKEIRKGGPPRDGIPALNYPGSLSLAEAGYVKPKDRVLGVVINGVARAYPIKVLNWHEVVNDVIGSQHFVVTYCPLCGTGMVFASNITDGENKSALVFGVSGLLYNSDVLLFDRQTDSLWSQILGESVSGVMKGTPLIQLAGFHTSWRDWVKRHPNTEVMAIDRKKRRDYERNPYAGYERTKKLMFKVNNKSSLDIHPKESVLGLLVGEEALAFTFTQLQKQNLGQFDVTLGGKAFTVHWNGSERSAHVTDSVDKDYPTTTSFWFAWYAFHPQTRVFGLDEVSK